MGRELKEAVLWSPAWASADRRATVLQPALNPQGNETLVANPETPPAEVRAPGRYLLDPSPAVTRAGDVWCLGRHRLICGDARDQTVFALLMGDERADLLFTDPGVDWLFSKSSGPSKDLVIVVPRTS